MVHAVSAEIPAAQGAIVEAAPSAPSRDGSDTAAAVVAQGVQTGSPWLELSVVDFAPGRSADRSVPDRETVLFVVAGSGALVAGGRRLGVEPHTGAIVPAAVPWAIEHEGPGDLRVVAVTARPGDVPATEAAVVRPAEQEARAATGDRSFRVVIDPASGCGAVTQFVGFVPPGRAPDHLHEYDEVIYVLEGRGVLHMDGVSTPFGAGTTIHLPPRLVHCLENVGDDRLVVLGAFTPAGSPSDAFYPDGTRAYYDPQ